MDSKRVGRSSQRLVWLALLLGQGLVAVAVVMLIRSRPAAHQGHFNEQATDHDALVREGSELKSRLDSWRRRASAAAIEVDDILVLPRPETTQTDSLQRASIGAASSATADAASCDPNGHPVSTVSKVDPKYLMRPAAEVAAENPEFTRLLAAYANDKREIMLGLTNAVMICKNTTLCWWNGGNILESFLEILERSKITNHLIGVTDDQAATYVLYSGAKDTMQPIVSQARAKRK